MRAQHIDSFNYFIETDIRKIVDAAPNREARARPGSAMAREKRESGRAKNRRRPPRARGGAARVHSEADPKFLLKYTDVYVGEPSVDENSYTWRDVTPFECRLRDCTCSAPIYVSVLYRAASRSCAARAVRSGASPCSCARAAACCATRTPRGCELNECPFDPGGYFVIKGVEKVILMQEQPRRTA